MTRREQLLAAIDAVSDEQVEGEAEWTIPDLAAKAGLQAEPDDDDGMPFTGRPSHPLEWVLRTPDHIRFNAFGPFDTPGACTFCTAYELGRLDRRRLDLAE